MPALPSVPPWLCDIECLFRIITVAERALELLKGTLDLLVQSCLRWLCARCTDRPLRTHFSGYAGSLPGKGSPAFSSASSSRTGGLDRGRMAGIGGDDYASRVRLV